MSCAVFAGLPADQMLGLLSASVLVLGLGTLILWRMAKSRRSEERGNKRSLLRCVPLWVVAIVAGPLMTLSLWLVLERSQPAHEPLSARLPTLQALLCIGVFVGLSVGAVLAVLRR